MDREGSVAGPHDTHNRQAEGMQVWWGEEIKITMLKGSTCWSVDFPMWHN